MIDVDKQFELWFKKEHGILDIYDFECTSSAVRWKKELQDAFRAGVESVDKHS